MADDFCEKLDGLKAHAAYISCDRVCSSRNFPDSFGKRAHEAGIPFRTEGGSGRNRGMGGRLSWFMTFNADIEPDVALPAEWLGDGPVA